MRCVASFGRFNVQRVHLFPLSYRCLSDSNGGDCDESKPVENEDHIGKRERLDARFCSREKLTYDNHFVGMGNDRRRNVFNDLAANREHTRRYQRDADIIYGVLQKDGPEYIAIVVLDEMRIKVTNHIVKEVLMLILRSINHANRRHSAMIGFKFFKWAEDQDGFLHSSNSYNIMLKVLANCKELGGVWFIFKKMIAEGILMTARTLNILICSCGQVGMAKRLVVWFMTSKLFNFRPFKHSYNAILHSLLIVDQFRLIEWVFRKMLHCGHHPDIFTYNILLCTKFRLGKHVELWQIFCQIVQKGIPLDLHTYNILLRVYGKANNPLEADGVLRHMDAVGCPPQTLHFTSLIDGLSRAGNLDACEYFFDKMLERGCEPDVVFYTVMITGYVVAGNLEKAQELFDEMIVKGKLPNLCTYNSMIRGLCEAGKFEEAIGMFEDMKKKGCHPNFSVYRRLVGNLRSARQGSKVSKLIKEMKEKGYHPPMIEKIKGYKK